MVGEQEQFQSDEEKYRYLQQCARYKMPAFVRYTDTDGEITESVVYPIALERDYNGVRYPGIRLTAYSDQLKTHRSFWYDRILHVQQRRDRPTRASLLAVRSTWRMARHGRLEVWPYSAVHQLDETYVDPLLGC